MIEINLLPEELRKKKSEPVFNLNMEDEKLRFLAICGAVGILILIVAVPSLGSFIRKAQINDLLSREKVFSDRLSKIDGINKEIIFLKTKMDIVDQIAKRKFIWAEKLNQLSDLVLPGIWFTRVYTDSSANKLTIEGSVISKSEEAMASVGKFMKNLKDDAQFFKEFKNIKLESVQREAKDEMGIVDFQIVLYFQ